IRRMELLPMSMAARRLVGKSRLERRQDPMSKQRTNRDLPTKRLAAIDIGSNSIRLMVAEATADGNYRILDDEKETTRLAQGLAQKGALSEEAVTQSLQALGRMK